MKMKRLSFLLFASLLFTTISVSNPKQNLDEELMIAVPSSELYVRVRGNPEGALILNLHGGPGGYSGIDIHLMGPGLEDKFLVAYLDQRGCGKSKECYNKLMLTVEQYVQDLDIVIDSLLNKYDKETVNLIGTSWGGMYGFLYLLHHQSKVNAFACVDGKVNSHYQNHSLISYELKLIEELLEDELSEERRNELKVIQRELIRIQESDFEQFHIDVNRMKHEFPAKLGFNAYFADTSKIISLDDVLEDTALMTLMKYSKEEYLQVGEKAEIVNEAFRNTPSYNNMNIEEKLKNITIPVAVIQGEKDFVVGVEHGELIYRALTNPDSKKELHIIPDTGHCPAIENPQLLNEILNSFFYKYM
jgi:pimeloyl-ACP methyl ester carboxylesterase